MEKKEGQRRHDRVTHSAVFLILYFPNEPKVAKNALKKAWCLVVWRQVWMAVL
ncbi:unnamed protein product [Sphenostylis stenocarpa]|uniref:Uncharacterized protein n=1 Tax=Sphenostylis stenocarpa TaxID=92480 RepID=A0AA86RPB1_9FABA|nr:unnamed protein product [Sphenostylis stenocarpa]